jgi:hypothetical protein
MLLLHASKQIVFSVASTGAIANVTRFVQNTYKLIASHSTPKKSVLFFDSWMISRSLTKRVEAHLLLVTCAQHAGERKHFGIESRQPVGKNR